MKTKLLFTSLFVFVAINLVAQNSMLEENLTRMGKDSTKFEKFLNDCEFYSWERFANIDEDLGFYAEAYIYKNLISNKKIGVLKFWNKSDKDDDEYFGTLDEDELDDLILAMRKIVDEATSKHYGKSCRVYYETRSGLSIYYKHSAREIYFRKRWYYINQYGVRYSFLQESKNSIGLKKFAKIIEWLTKSKEVLQKELKNPD